MSESGSLRNQIGQLINVRVGSKINPCTSVAEDFERVADLVDQFGIGSLCLFNGGTAADVASTLDRLQTRSATPLLVGADMECGSGQQIVDHCQFPHAMAFGAAGGDAAELVEQAARITAQQSRAVGIHISFSPVADINRNPDNPIIATRAFGTTADRVGELAGAYTRGCHAGGALCCAKHFPGHGNTFEDSHAAMPVVNEPRSVLDQTDLPPFRVLAQSDVDLFMTAHVAYPALDPTGKPATLSHAILTRLLRNEWGFSGAIISDSFKMDGLRKQHACEGELAIAAIDAGVDILLDVTDVATIMQSLELKANADSAFADRIAQAAARVATLKQKAFDTTRQSSEDQDLDVLGQQLARQVALTAIKVDGALSLPISNPVPAVILNPQGDVGYTNTATIRTLLANAPTISTVYRVEGAEDPEQLAYAVAEARELRGCLVVLVLAPSAWQRYGLPDWQKEFVGEVMGVCPAIVASLGLAEPLQQFAQAALRVAAFSDTAVTQAALVEICCGSSSV